MRQFLHWVKPRQESIFDNFDKLTGVLLEIGREMEKLPKAVPHKLALEAQVFRKLEHKADKITHNIIDKINKTFVTPLDREDLHTLAKRIDDVIDLVENGVSNLAVYNVKEMRPPFKEFCSVINLAAKEIYDAVRGLRTLDNIPFLVERMTKINQLETKGDELLQEAFSDLFKNEKDAITLIKWKDIFQILEVALDRAEDVSNVIEAIIIKNA